MEREKENDDRDREKIGINNVDNSDLQITLQRALAVCHLLVTSVVSYQHSIDDCHVVETKVISYIFFFTLKKIKTLFWLFNFNNCVYKSISLFFVTNK